MLKQQIRDTLIRKDGKINSAIIRREWFKSSQLYTDIIKQTEFLNFKNPPWYERIYCILNDIVIHPHCSICGNYSTFLPNKDCGYSRTCGNFSCKSSDPIALTKRKTTMLTKYGALISDKSRTSMILRIPELQQKGKITMLSKYGVSNAFLLPHSITKSRETRNKNLNSTEYKQQKIINLMNKWKNDKYEVLEIIIPPKEFNLIYKVKLQCNTCKHIDILPFETLKWRLNNLDCCCTKCSGLSDGSNLQLQIKQYIESILNYNIDSNNREILKDYSLEIDLVIPEKKIGFEVDGIFWHSFNHIESLEERNYHKIKQQLANTYGIKLFRIWENEWIFNQEIVKSRIKTLLGISDKKEYARNCIIRELTEFETKEFLSINHIQGYSKSAVYKIGLIANDTILAVMTFSKSRFDKKYEWEIHRFCIKNGYNIPGAAGKLFSYFVKHMNPSSTVTYSDLRWGEGNVYRHLGFTRVNDTRPNYFYFNGGYTLHSRWKYQKHKLSKLLEHFDPNLSEAENMFNNKFRRIWDCGNAKWVWTNPNITQHHVME